MHSKWFDKESRPGLAVQVNISQQDMSEPRGRDCRNANHVVKRAVQHHVGIRILPIPERQLRLVLLSDAALQNARGRASQGGYVVAATDDMLAHGEMAPWSLWAWRSFKMKRVV